MKCTEIDLGKLNDGTLDYKPFIGKRFMIEVYHSPAKANTLYGNIKESIEDNYEFYLVYNNSNGLIRKFPTLDMTFINDIIFYVEMKEEKEEKINNDDIKILSTLEDESDGSLVVTMEISNAMKNILIEKGFNQIILEYLDSEKNA